MKRRNGFTLIELLAVIIILGILMIIAIPSVTSYINNSRKSAYVDTAKQIVAGARNLVNEGKIDFYSKDTTYYIKAKCIATENGQKSPYGDFDYDKTFVIVTFDGNSYNYYWVSRDVTGQGVSSPVLANNLSEESIESDLAHDDIKNNLPIGTRTKIQIIDENCQKVESPAADTANAIPEGGNTTPSTPTAASTILSTAQAGGQLNQIPNTDIYIFKGSNPSNYVTFNGESWRIIGIYGNQLKIQKVTAPTGLTSVQWNTSTQNLGWANSSLKTYLNGTYYDTLSQEAKGMIYENGSWNVGPVSINATALEAYTSSTTTSSVENIAHTTPWVGKVGLIATYEFLYASSGENCLTTSGDSYGTGCGLSASDWMKPGTKLWTISPRSGDVYVSLIVSSNGSVNSNNVDGTRQALPVLFLKPTVKIISGTGVDADHAYVLQ